MHMETTDHYHDVILYMLILLISDIYNYEQYSLTHLKCFCVISSANE